MFLSAHVFGYIYWCDSYVISNLHGYFFWSLYLKERRKKSPVDIYNYINNTFFKFCLWSNGSSFPWLIHWLVHNEQYLELLPWSLTVLLLVCCNTLLSCYHECRPVDDTLKNKVLFTFCLRGLCSNLLFHEQNYMIVSHADRPWGCRGWGRWRSRAKCIGIRSWKDEGSGPKQVEMKGWEVYGNKIMVRQRKRAKSGRNEGQGSV